VWGAPLEGGHAGEAKGWSQQPWDWWATHNLAFRETRLVWLSAYGDSQREIFKPRHAAAALDMAAVQAVVSMAILLYGFSP
jgi:hypothetical protein